MDSPFSRSIFQALLCFACTGVTAFSALGCGQSNPLASVLSNASNLTAPTFESVLYFHPNHLGSNVLVTDGTSTVVQRAVTDPYGGVQKVVNASGNPTFPVSPYVFAGHYWDSESNNHYMNARYMDPSTGRFLGVDPALIGSSEGETFKQLSSNPGSLNAYAYANNNPTTYTDPTGRFSIGNMFGDMFGDIDSGGGAAGGAFVQPYMSDYDYMLAWEHEQASAQALQAPLVDPVDILAGFGASKLSGVPSRAMSMADDVAGASGTVDVSHNAYVWGEREMRVMKLDGDTPVYRVQMPDQELIPHDSPYFDPSEYGIQRSYTAEGKLVGHEALYVSPDQSTLHALRKGQGYFDDGAVMRETTLGAVLRDAGPDAVVLWDDKFAITQAAPAYVVVRPNIAGNPIKFYGQ